MKNSKFQIHQTFLYDEIQIVTKIWAQLLRIHT